MDTDTIHHRNYNNVYNWKENMELSTSVAFIILFALGMYTSGYLIGLMSKYFKKLFTWIERKVCQIRFPWVNTAKL